MKALESAKRQLIGGVITKDSIEYYGNGEKKRKQTGIDELLHNIIHKVVFEA